MRPNASSPRPSKRTRASARGRYSAEARGDVLSAVNHRARIRDETRHISYARALVKALVEEDAGNLDVIQQWQDESLRLFIEVARGGTRREWWDGFLGSDYKIALPMGLKPTPLPSP